MVAEHILILGGTSDMALALARAYAGRGAHLTLAARNPERLDADIADLRIRGAASARHVACDILQSNAAAFIDALGTLPDAVICVVGLLGDQAAAQNDGALAQTILRSNFEGANRQL